MALRSLLKVPAVLERHLPLITANRTFYLYSPEPFHPLVDRTPRWTTAEDAVKVIESGNRVFVHSAAATPFKLVEAMVEWGIKEKLKDIECIHMHTEGPASYNNPECEGIFRSNSCFTGANCRKAINTGKGDYIPIFLGEIPLLFRRKILNLDVALISVSPPDKHGFCTLGPSVDCTRAAIQNAKYIIGLVNQKMPRTFGDGVIHMSHFDSMVEDDMPLYELPLHPPSPAETAIGQLIADNLVQDAATLQMGIGSIPDAVLAALKTHRDLGIHSEMVSDGIIDLVECGAVTNARKVIQTGKVVTGFAIGTERLYKFLDDNPFIVMCDIAFTNSTAIICQNPKVTAINSCIEVDLTGQIVADSIGTKIYSGVGGQIDFIRGAALSLDGLGKPILAMPSTTKRGESKIVPFIKEGAGVTTTRSHVHYVVTEHGIAYLFGKNIRQRAYELIKIAHPDHRESLEKAAFDRLKCMPSP